MNRIRPIFIIFPISMPIILAGVLYAQQETIIFKSSQGDATFAHRKHTELSGVACGACHHTASGNAVDQTCKDCHTAGKQGDVPALKDALHKTCLDCHKSRKVGPATCAACHIKKAATPSPSKPPMPAVPQPTTLAEIEPQTPLVLAASNGSVRFEHREHTVEEGISCVSCHHTSVDGKDGINCKDCHSPTKQGNAPALQDAMHRKCIDCHKARGDGPRKCANCHKANKGDKREQGHRKHGRDPKERVHEGGHHREREHGHDD